MWRLELTQKYLKACVNYDPATGVFIWLRRPKVHFKTERVWKTWNTRFSSRPAGSIGGRVGEPRLTIHILGAAHYAHRLAWLYQTGSFPVNDIDHIDGNGANNRWANLRDVTNAVNRKNQRLSKSNTTGVTGVTRVKGKFMAYIFHAGVMKYLGYFDTLEEAARARSDANIRYGYHPNHGKKRGADK